MWSNLSTIQNCYLRPRSYVDYLFIVWKLCATTCLKIDSYVSYGTKMCHSDETVLTLGLPW